MDFEWDQDWIGGVCVKNRFRKKLRSQRGDSLSETLVALLVGCLALVMLAGAITTSASLVTRSREKMQEYYAANNAIVSGGSAEGVTSGTVTVTISGGVSQNLGTYSYRANNTVGGKTVIAYH